MPWKWDCGPRSALGLISTWEGRRGSLQFGREEKEIWAASSFSSFQTGKSQNKPQSYTKVKQIRHLKDETSRSCSFWNARVCEHHWTKNVWKQIGESAANHFARALLIFKCHTERDQILSRRVYNLWLMNSFSIFRSEQNLLDLIQNMSRVYLLTQY